MAKRRGRPLNGILLLNKPMGMTSNAALQAVKAMFFAAKAGHTGSLDPLATGVLPICFGEATKFSQFLLDSDKVYRTTVVLGETRTSGDADGEVLEQRDASALTAEQVGGALESFRGEIEQLPSMYSAIKVGGTPLYKLARAGQEVERERRRVVVHDIRLEGFRPGTRAEADLYIACSKGTYVRTIAEDLGQQLGVGAHVGRLHRVQAGPFGEDRAISLDALETMRQEKAFAAMDALILPVDTAVADLPEVLLTPNSGYYLRQGQPVLVPHLPTSGLVRIRVEDGEFLGVGEILEDGRLAPRRLVV